MVTPELLRQLLVLPDGVRITSVGTVDEHGGLCVQLTIEGEDLPSDGTPLPRVRAMYHRVDGEVVFQGWVQ